MKMFSKCTLIILPGGRSNPIWCNAVEHFVRQGEFGNLARIYCIQCNKMQFNDILLQSFGECWSCQWKSVDREWREYVSAETKCKKHDAMLQLGSVWASIGNVRNTKVGQNAKCNQVSLENCKIIWATLGGCCQWQSWDQARKKESGS